MLFLSSLSTNEIGYHLGKYLVSKKGSPKKINQVIVEQFLSGQVSKG